MITLKKIANAGAALSYYSEKDDYYLEGGGAPAAFYGHGAAELNLAGPMTSQRQARVFADVLANGGGKAGRHTPGWDVTFSAPKSVSVAALMGGNERLIAAHERAVARALEWIEKHAIVTRQRGAGGEGYEWRHGAGMVAATFRHSTSREQEPQLHTHVVISNTTRDPLTGEWRALDSRELYRAQAEAGAIYAGELAAEARQLGYAVEWRINDKGHPEMELGSVPQAIRDQFSSRRAQTDAWLIAHGLTRETATAAQKQEAALQTRRDKEPADHTELRAQWLKQARAIGYEPTQRPLPLPPVRDPTKAAAAVVAVRQAAEHLGERDARFSVRALEHAARLFAEGRANSEQIREAIGDLAKKGELQHRDVQERATGGRRTLTAGFTTRAGIETETKMLRSAEVLRSRAATIGGPETATAGQLHRAAAEAIRRTEITNGREFGDEQRTATTSILTEAKSIHVLHGHAGTAKTSSVLACVRDAAEREGYSVRAMAPTNAAAQKLGDSIQATGHSTVASHLHRDALRSPFDSDRAPPTSGSKRELWIVDEAGMVSARDMQRLLSKAEREHASVVLVGDTKQLGSVEAGEAFEQLRSKLGSADLTDIKRQQDPQLREAVYDSLRGEVQAALSKVPVIEAKTRVERVAEITRQYMSQSSKEREETLVIAPGKDDREQINDAIRAARRERGELGREEVTITVLEKSELTPAALRQAARYQPGWILEADRRYEFGPMRGERGEVARIENGMVVVKLQRGRGEYEWKFDPRKTSSFQVYSGKRELAVAEGDKLVAKASLDAEKIHGGGDAVIKTGTPLDVVAVKDREIIVRDAGGVEMAIARNTPQQLDYGYAQTVHQAQGQDYAKAIGHLESRRENLSSLKSMYVALSRAREKFTVVTDNRDALAATLERNTGQKATALVRPNEQTVTAPYELGKLAEYREPQGPAPTPPEPSTAPTPESVSVAPEPLPEIAGSPTPTPEPVPATPEPQPEVTDSPAPAPEPGHEPSHDDGPAWG
ncbi:MobF family relaxase [Rhodanobacter aciditrophus]|uniref:MobF family relaxase n=1 Tax=Rhodanobacter aciditrophus TaxID=1623218 RepID=UPI003CF102CB